MKVNLRSALAIAALFASAVCAEETGPPADTQKVSYALGMNLGIQVKQMDADVDVDTLVQAMKDVREGKQTRLRPDELGPLFRQEEKFARARITAQDQAAGAAFLARNATNSGVTVLPDGLQYRVLKEGTGPAPHTDDFVVVNYRGTRVDGSEFDRHDHFRVSLASQIRGWQEALPLMKAGSKWQIVLPPSLAYGRKWMRQIGPESTVIFEIELLSVSPASAQSGGPGVIQQ